MKKKSLDNTRLKLNKDVISSLTNEQMNDVNGGRALWGSRALCFASKAADCTQASCADGAIVCIPIGKAKRSYNRLFHVRSFSKSRFLMRNWSPMLMRRR